MTQSVEGDNKVALIGSAPLPQWRALAALAGPAADPIPVAQPWSRGAPSLLLSRSAWSLALIARILEGRPLFVPGHFCNGSLAPARAIGARLVFYPVTADLTPDWPACRAMAHDRPPGAFVLVHPFGQPNDLDGARAFCGATGAILVEDAAHALLPMGGIGDAGDLVLFSPHKLVGSPDGAVLVARDPAILERRHPALAPASPSPWRWLAKRLIQKLELAEGMARRRLQADESDFFRDPNPTELPQTPRVSGAALRMLATLGPALPALAQRRQRQEQALRPVLAALVPGRPAFASWRAAPYRAAWLCDDSEGAARAFVRLRRAGIAAESWPDLAPEVTSEPILHAQALDWRRRLLLTPLPEDWTPESLTERYRAAL